ncbi:TetR/AcrR family transcriptional regulator [Nocardiopsis composta]|uniref:AcrR family transcriptional regulator n=1 Tax=Nocardiopsis composta TaxID=157465 RepID=A0A7W8QHL0_9ACTN|nr:TetR/AcrR family transcriptional regulator [Nocardiopsis composta]MBB5430486.1 AcrR family transcriptional regulator [Nocardiopsis composta]
MPRPTIPDRAGTVLDRARDVILEKGYRRATIADIAARAGVGKGAVYLDFASKEELLDALLARSMRDLAREVRDRAAASAEPVTLSAAFRFGLEALLGDRLLLALHLSDEDVLGDYVRTKGPERYRARMDWLGDYLVDLQRAGLLRGDLDPGAASLLMSVFGVGLANAAASLGGLPPERLAEAVSLMADLITAGWEEPASRTDPEAARRAHAALLDRLDAQIGADR